MLYFCSVFFDFSEVLKQVYNIIRNIRERRLILGLSFIIGLLSGGAAILLKNLTHFIEVRSKAALLDRDVAYLLPVLGIFLTVLFVETNWPFNLNWDAYAVSLVYGVIFQKIIQLRFLLLCKFAKFSTALFHQYCTERGLGIYIEIRSRLKKDFF